MKLCNLNISWLWIPFLLCVPYTSMWKTLGFLFFFLSLHETAHIIVAQCFHYPIRKVILYPFGLCAVIDTIGYRNGLQDFLILIAGPATHLIQPCFLMVLHQVGLISQIYMEYLMMMNASILLFNILPIYPLDGGRLLEIFLQLFFPFTFAKRISYATSIALIISVSYFHIFRGVSGIAVCLLLLLENIMAFTSLTYKKIQFYQYRLAHPTTYRIRMNTHHDLYRFSYNVMKHHDHWINEDRWLSIFFHKR